MNWWGMRLFTVLALLVSGFFAFTSQASAAVCLCRVIASDVPAGTQSCIDTPASLITPENCANLDESVGRADIQDCGYQEVTNCQVWETQNDLNTRTQTSGGQQSDTETDVIGETLRQKIRSLDQFQSIQGATAADRVAGLIGRIIKILLSIIGTTALVMFVYGGVEWMIARGDSGRIDRAKNIILYAAIGVIVVLSSYAVASFVFDAFV